MNKNHRDQQYYELGCQAMGEAMTISAGHRQHLNALKAVADAAQAVCDWYEKAKPWLYVSADHVPLSLMHKLQCALEDVGKSVA